MFHTNNCILIGFFLAFCASIECDSTELDLNKIDVDKIREQLPAGLHIPDINNSSLIKAADNGKRLFKEKCKQLTGNDDAYERIESSIGEFQECLTGLIDFNVMNNEIEAAKPTGELDVVFNKYCRRRTTAFECMENFTRIVEPCLEPKEIDGKNTLVKIAKNLLNFVCYKDGDQIALFIAEKGPECFNERKDYLITCTNNTIYNYLPSQAQVDNDTYVLPKFFFDNDRCNDMNKLRDCVVDTLEKCEESTPANLVDAMFRYVRKETPCNDITDSKSNS